MAARIAILDFDVVSLSILPTLCLWMPYMLVLNLKFVAHSLIVIQKLPQNTEIQDDSQSTSGHLGF